MRRQFALVAKAAATRTDELDAPGNAVDAPVRRVDTVLAGELSLKVVASSPVAKQFEYWHLLLRRSSIKALLRRAWLANRCSSTARALN